MSIQDSTNNRIAPKSILRHRPIEERPKDKQKVADLLGTSLPSTPRASRPETSKVESGEVIAEWQRVKERTRNVRLRNSANHKNVFSVWYERYIGSKGMRTRIARQKTHIFAHPFFYLALGMIIMLPFWIFFSSLLGWVHTFHNDIVYGRPRTYQTDAWVGHNTQTGKPSHFLALNLNGRIEVIEFPGGDATQAHVYVGPQLYEANSDLIPVTLRFSDVNNDHKLDMIVLFQGSNIVFINDGTGFRAPLPAERDQVEQTLQHLSG
ncbi:MAG TPA: hypothetical protein VL461_14970 [Dictyobacter sp.]|jgi:hypothetical protein|nr:hypothetical protein [Dictyobacter sp.]